MTETLSYRWPGDIGGPMTPGEAYRWNLPTITYGFDESFLEYFGEEGVRAVEEAFAVLNELPAISEIDLNDYPTNSTPVNVDAEALGYLDEKSHTLSLLLHQLGLAEPRRNTFALRMRDADATQTNYAVIGLNYDPFSLVPVSNVNGANDTYEIYQWARFDGSTNPPVALPGPERATSVTISARLRDDATGPVFEWTVVGTPGAVYQIESTTDFASWSAVTTVTNVDGHFVFTAPATSPRTFYRAVRQ